MAKGKEVRTLEEGILLVHARAAQKPIAIGEVLRILSGRGRPVLLILLSLPFCQPIQIPGFSFPFGLAISFVGLRMAFGKHLWLPKKLLSKKVPVHTLDKITDKTLLVVRKIKRWIHPRLQGVCRSPIMEKVNGLLICLLGIFLALPLPIPLSNLTAAWSIFLLSLGMLEDDGGVVLIGYGLSLLTVGFFVGIALSIMRIV